jgi:hypothetical protein
VDFAGKHRSWFATEKDQLTKQGEKKNDVQTV